MKVWRVLAVGGVVLSAMTLVVGGGVAAASSPNQATGAPTISLSASGGHQGVGTPLHMVGLRAVSASHSSGTGSGFLVFFQQYAKQLSIKVGRTSAVSLDYGDYAYGLVPSGTYTVVATSGASTVATGTVTVSSGQYVTAMIYPAKGGAATITGFVNDQTPVPVGKSRIVLRNTANVGPVDIYLNGVRVASHLANTPSSPQSVSLIIPAEKLNITVVRAGQPLSNFLYFQPGQRVLPGDLLNTFVIGYVNKTVNHIHLLNSATPLGVGYRLYAADGGVFNFGDASYFGSMGGKPLNKPIVGAAPTTIGLGYWLVATDGGIFSFGNASFYGSAGHLTLNKPVVGMAATPNGGGYWLVASDGGIFSYGNAGFYGSTGGQNLNKPIVGMAATPDGRGYWLVASDGGVFSFGDAGFYGSTGAISLNKPIVAIVPTVDGHGYWLVASDGGVFSFGNAHFYGSTGGIHLNKPIVAAMAANYSLGYWLVASDGGVFSFGAAQFYGSTGAIALNAPIVFGSAPGALIANH